MMCRNQDSHRDRWYIVRHANSTQHHCFECGVSWEERAVMGW